VSAAPLSLDAVVSFVEAALPGLAYDIFYADGCHAVIHDDDTEYTASGETLASALFAAAVDAIKKTHA
jgi:hypothetical protein